MNAFLKIRPTATFAALLALALSGCKHRPLTAPPPPATGPIAPAPLPKAPEPKHERIFFLKGDATLSPGALKKLKAWAASWGTDGTWVLAFPSNTDIATGLRERRLQTLRSQLQQHGVVKIETRQLPPESTGKYDAVYIEK